MKGKSVVEEFLSEPSEVHAFFLGVWHSFANLIHPQPLKGLPEELRKELRREWHYFCGGFLAARLVQVLLLVIFLTGVAHAAAAAESPYYHKAVDLDLNDDGQLSRAELLVTYAATHRGTYAPRLDFNRDGRCNLRDWQIVAYVLRTYRAFELPPLRFENVTLETPSGTVVLPRLKSSYSEFVNWWGGWNLVGWFSCDFENHSYVCTHFANDRAMSFYSDYGVPAVFPIFITHPVYHAAVAILVGDDPLDRSSWLCLEPQTPGWSQPPWWAVPPYAENITDTQVEICLYPCGAKYHEGRICWVNVTT
ncbi:MAG: hypothetical protein ACXQT6_01855, partial [Candidatus Methanospirareceae archaeon]